MDHLDSMRISVFGLQCISILGCLSGAMQILFKYYWQGLQEFAKTGMDGKPNYAHQQASATSRYYTVLLPILRFSAAVSQISV
jgi:hypothetical protein